MWIIVPYTPQITFNYRVNYETTEITHSNLYRGHYKNSPPPSIGLNAIFTADTRENALHMLSALWFLRGLTKCDFGERANEDSNAIAGMPPPILYLKGYNSIMDNIPVIVTSFNYSLPQDKHYASLGINLDSETQSFKDTYLYSDVSQNDNLYASFNGNISGDDGIKYLNGVANSLKALQSEATIMETNKYNSYYFNNWLPTEMKFEIQLQIQPNLLKHKKKFNLNWYKVGLDNLEDYRGDTPLNTPLVIPSKSGSTDITSKQCDGKTITAVYDNILNNDIMSKLNKKEELYKSFISVNKAVESLDNKLINFGKSVTDTTKSLKDTASNFFKGGSSKNDTNSVNQQIESKEYKFDKSGWS